MDTSKVQIGFLEGKSNWTTWKYKASILLSSSPDVLDVLEGNLKKPLIILSLNTEEKAKYDLDLARYNKANCSALLVLTTNMTEDTLKKVMRFTSAYEVWQELHRLFDGICEDKAYDLCLQFFGYQRQIGDDIANHLSKLKNLWSDLKQEITKEDGNCNLPDLMLVCKILGTLPEEYFSFKSSWMLMNKSERTIENLTIQLCAFERALTCREGASADQEVLVAAKTVKHKKPNARKSGNSKGTFICYYCKQQGHKVTQCEKWKADGRPSKAESEQQQKLNIVLELVSEVNQATTDSYERNSWFVDNGATNHVTNRRDLFQTFEPFGVKHTVTTANGVSIVALGKGTILLEAAIDGKWERFTLKEVWCVPNIKKNLFSVLAAQDRNPRSEFVSTSEVCKFKIGGQVRLLGVRSRYGGLYKLALRNVLPTISTDVNSLTGDDLLQLYHERMGHQNKRHVKAVLEKELGINVKLNGELCEGCIYGKAHRLKFGTRERASKPGAIIHSDVCGPFLPSMSGYRYYVLFRDDFTHYRFIYFIRKKSEVPEKLQQMLAEVKTTGHVVQEFLSDNGGEFDSKIVSQILQKNGIRQRLIMPHTPEQNGCSERENRTVVEAARAIMHAQEDLPQTLWAEMVNAANYILNRTGHSGVDGKSPHEIWIGKKPNLKHLRIIGSTCYAHIPKQKRKKMDKKASKGILVGYENDDGYRIWNRKSLTIIRSRDVIFQEQPLIHRQCTGLPVFVDQENEQPVQQEDELEEKDCEEGSITPNNNDIIDHELSNEPDVTEDDATLETGSVLRERSKIKPHPKYDDYVMETVANVLETDEPGTYGEAVQCAEHAQWKNAMDAEMKSLKENGTWSMEGLPKGKKAIPCRWVFKVKTNPDGSIERYKARLVIKGFSQRKGVDYNQTFSPVAKSGTIRTLLSVAASERMSLMQFDVSTAFLYGELQEDVYMCQPEGYEDGTSQVCHLKRSLYGLKQAPRCWNKRFGNFLEKLGFKPSDADPCLYIQRKGQDKLMVALYVDDGLVASTSKERMEEFLRNLKMEFKITTKPASYFLGLELECRENGEIKVSQGAYARKILERFNMSECKPINTPIIKESIEPEKVQDIKVEEQKFPYREAVGALMYLMTGTRPDIAYAVGVASRTLENPSEKDWIRVKRILRYLKGTQDLGVVYKPDFQKGILESYSDADHGGDEETGRSTTGVICLYAGGAISWLSQRQSSVAISTTEAEVVAASEAARELIWLKRLLQDMVQLNSVPELQVDNEAAIRLAQNPEYHRRTKHIKTRHFFVREQVTDGSLIVKKVATEFQLADMLTKPLHKPRLQIICKDLGLSHE